MKNISKETAALMMTVIMVACVLIGLKINNRINQPATGPAPRNGLSLAEVKAITDRAAVQSMETTQEGKESVRICREAGMSDADIVKMDRIVGDAVTRNREPNAESKAALNCAVKH